MRRLTSVFTHTVLVAALTLFVAVPAVAQQTPAQSRPLAVRPPATTTVQPGIAMPTSMPPGQQAGQGQSQTPPTMAAPRPEAPRAPSIGSQNNMPMPAATNIRLDLTITDTFTGSPVKKSVSLLVLTGNNGMIRTTGADGWANLNIDAVAAAYVGGLVSIRMTFEYTPAMTKETNRPPRLNESITVVLQDGKPLVVSQSADPATDRKVTAELTATILK